MSSTKVSQESRRLLKGLLTIDLDDTLSSSKVSTLKGELLQNSKKCVELAYQLYFALPSSSAEVLEGFGDFERSEITTVVVSKLVSIFVQLNSTGPKDSSADEQSTLSSQELLGMEWKTHLEVDGLEVCSHARVPQLLVLAKGLLEGLSKNEEVWIGDFAAWWALRVHFLHQKILDGRSVALASSIATIISVLSGPVEALEGDEDLKVLWFCELTECHLFYYDVVKAKVTLSLARKASKAEFYTTGVLGKRTRFQQKDLAQLVVKASIEEDQDDRNTFFLDELKDSCPGMNLPLQDDTRLDKPNLVETSENRTRLSTIQQCMLNCEMNFIRKSQAKDELLKQDILAYVQTLLEEPKLWNIFFSSLVQRCTFETDHSRTVERSMMQLEVLKKSVEADVPSFPARYQFYFASWMPMIWELDLILADVLLSLGQTKSALDLYLRLNLWENVILCYTLLELRHKAEEVIREEISKVGETPKLLVYLGDTTNDISYYQKAWTLSKERNFLSRQRLGVYWFKKQEYEKAIPYFQQAVALNPLEHPVWIRLAYAALEVERWDLAVKSYTHANNLDDESFENWNNLAKAALKLGNKEQALRALKQATKCNYDEWKVWENLLFAAIQCFDVEWAIMAFNRLIDIKGSYSDEVALRILVDLVTDDSWDKKGDTTKRCQDMMLKLLGRVSAKLTTNAEVWQSYSTLLYRISTQSQPTENPSTASDEESTADKWYKLVQFQQKVVRCRIQEKNWDKLPELTKKAVDAVHTLCIRTSEYISKYPSNPGSQEFKTQAQYLHKQVSNTVNKKIKEVIDPSKYEELLVVLESALSLLTS